MLKLLRLWLINHRNSNSSKLRVLTPQQDRDLLGRPGQRQLHDVDETTPLTTPRHLKATWLQHWGMALLTLLLIVVRCASCKHIPRCQLLLTIRIRMSLDNPDQQISGHTQSDWSPADDLLAAKYRGAFCVQEETECQLEPG